MIMCLLKGSVKSAAGGSPPWVPSGVISKRLSAMRKSFPDAFTRGIRS
jgi:hypothetical protein